MFTCTKCGKEWATNYCPECAGTIDQSDDIEKFIDSIDGDIVNGTFATCAAQIRLNPMRYLWLAPGARYFLAAWAGTGTGSVAAFLFSEWIWGGVLAVLFFGISFLLLRIVRVQAVIFENAALVPGLVVNNSPLEMICAAGMGTGMGAEPAYAVKRVIIDRLPLHSNQLGTEFPCVASFVDGKSMNWWGNFFPQPLSHGTGDVREVEGRRAKLGKEEFLFLRRLYELKSYPDKFNGLMWVSRSSARPCPPPVSGT